MPFSIDAKAAPALSGTLRFIASIAAGSSAQRVPRIRCACAMCTVEHK